MSTTSRSGSQYYDVHLGFWTNWSYGAIEGATITLTRRDGNLLIAFLALFVATTGKSLWRLSCFILHRYLSTPSSQDAIYHQRQAILRNADTPSDGAWRLLQSFWAWRNNGRRPALRLLPIVLLAMFTGAAFSVAGIFSSRVTSDTGNEVLINGGNCGYMYTTNDTTAEFNYRQPWLAQRATAHSNYALQCYTNATNAEDCHLYVRPRLQTKVTRNATCPFSKEMCRTQDENIIVDSGLIDSHKDLGINAPPKERFQMRFVHHCAPIVAQDFKNVTKDPKNPDGPEIVRYYYGNLTYNAGPEFNYSGFTHEVRRNFSQMGMEGYTSPAGSRPDFQLGVVNYVGGDNVTRGDDILEFNAIPQLARSDADTSLFFLTTQGIGFTEQVDDLWYSAHDPWLVPLSSTGSNATKPLYLTDEPANTLGCTAQFQFCNPNLPEDKRCEPIQSHKNAKWGSPETQWSAAQLNSLNWAGKTMASFFSPSDIAAFIGVSMLSGRYHLSYGLSGPIPRNQWHLEVEHMVGSSLASLQGAFVDMATGPQTEELQQFKRKPKTNEAMKMCHGQKIISTLYSSFSVLGLCIILLMGALLIGLDLVLEPALNFYHSRKNLPHHTSFGKKHARLEWRATNTLQLQRLAHSAIGSGTWSKTSDETPITKANEKLGVLDITDEKCPILKPSTRQQKLVIDINKPVLEQLQRLNRQQTDLSERTLAEGLISPKKKELRRVRTDLSERTIEEGMVSPPPKSGLRRAGTDLSDGTLAESIRSPKFKRRKEEGGT